jgi:hypothetical protein
MVDSVCVAIWSRERVSKLAKLSVIETVILSISAKPYLGAKVQSLREKQDERKRFCLPTACRSPVVQRPTSQNMRPYVITIKDASDWQIGDYPVDLGGVDFRDLPTVWLRTKFFLLTPLRRVLLRPWFRIIARVGETGTDEDFVDPDQDQLPGHVNALDEPLVPHRAGELYLYVNDAVLPLFMNSFYRHNHGTATVMVTQKDKR